MKVQFFIHLQSPPTSDPILILQKKEPHGDEGEPVPESLIASLENITSEQLKSLSVNQIKKVRLMMDSEMDRNSQALAVTEASRNAALREIGNTLDPSVPISNDEVSAFWH